MIGYLAFVHFPVDDTKKLENIAQASENHCESHPQGHTLASQNMVFEKERAKNFYENYLLSGSLAGFPLSQ